MLILAFAFLTLSVILDADFWHFFGGRTGQWEYLLEDG